MQDPGARQRDLRLWFAILGSGAVVGGARSDLGEGPAGAWHHGRRLTRAVRRWFGRTPGRMREEAGGDGR